MNRAPLTKQGAERLRGELEHLRKVVRPRVIQAIADARAHGDLKENAEYHAAREEQSFTEGRIKELEVALSNSQIIDPAKLDQRDRIVFGAIVELEEVDSGNAVTYQIVGDLEADIKDNRISVSSPIARALIGKQEGDEVVFQAPGGEREYEVLSVRYE